MNSKKGFKLQPMGLLTVLLLLAVPFLKATAEDYTKRFLRGPYAPIALEPNIWPYGSSWRQDTNYSDLRINFLFGLENVDAQWCTESLYCCCEAKVQAALNLYANESGNYTEPTNLSEWKSSINSYIASPPNCMEHMIAEEHPELYDKIYHDGANYIISKELPSEDLVSIVGNLGAIRPDFFLHVKGVDGIWVYPYPFRHSYHPDQTPYAAYQDSIQAKCVDYYDKVANAIRMYRRWGICPDLQMRVCPQSWFQAIDPDDIPDGKEDRYTRKPTREEMLFEGWLAVSRGAKGLGHFLYKNGEGTGFVGLVDSRGKRHTDDYENEYFYTDSDGNNHGPYNSEISPGGSWDGDEMFAWTAELFAQLEHVDTILKNDYDFVNGLYDLDVVEFRSEQGNMSSLGFVWSIVVTDPEDKSQAYYEVSYFNSPKERFFLLLNRTMHLSSVTYNLQIVVPHPGYWRLVDIVSETTYPTRNCLSGTYFWEGDITLQPCEAALFALEYMGGGEGVALTSTCREATGYSNGRKIALSKEGNDIYTYLVYTDGTSTPHINYAFSDDMGQTWEVWDQLIWRAEFPTIVTAQGDWPIIAYDVPGTGGSKTYRIYDHSKGLNPKNPLSLRTCHGGSPVSMAIHNISKTEYEAHVVFHDMRASRLCHYILREDFYSTGDYEYHELYWPAPPAPRRPCVVCDSTGRPYIFFAYDADIRNHANEGYIYLWDGKSDDAVKLSFAEGWDGTAYIEDPNLLLTWVAKAQSTWPRGKIHAKRGLLRYGHGEPQWVGSGDYEEVDPNFDKSEVQPMGADAALWQSQSCVCFSARDENGRNPSNPWIPCIPLDHPARCPQSALEPELFTYATAWTKGNSAPYSIEVNVGQLSNIPGGNWGAVHVLSPNGGEYWHRGETRIVTWSSSIINTTYYMWKIYLSTDGGNTWPDEPQNASNLHREGNLYTSKYEVPLVNSSQCRIKVEYYPSSKPYDISDKDFTIGWWVPQVPIYPFITGIQPPGSKRKIYWETSSFTSLEGIGFQYSLNNGGSWNQQTMLFSGTLYTPDDSLLLDTLISADSSDTAHLYKYWGTIDWTIPNAPTSAAKIKLTAYDTLGASASSIQDSSFVIPLPGGWEHNTYANQNIWGLNDAGNKLGLFYMGRNPADTSKPIIYYTESSDGYSLNTPDSISVGRLPSHECGESFWLSVGRDTVFASHWNVPDWSDPISISGQLPEVYQTLHSPVGIAMDADTVHVAFEKWLYVNYPSPDTIPLVIHARLLKDAGIILGVDTILGTVALAQTTPSESQPSIQTNGGETYIAFMQGGLCNLAVDCQGAGFSTALIGSGTHPMLALSEGNVTYSYLAPDGKALIRLWRYRDDTAWVGWDTFALADSTDFLSGEHGILYSTHVGGDSICKTYLYDPLGQNLIQRATAYRGSYPHSYLWKCSDDQWTECYTGYLDTFRFVKTETHDLNAFFPSLYQEARLKRSPYTTHRDTCVEYDNCTVDYGADSLIYSFNRLNPALTYAVMVEFYFESEIDTTISVLAQVGGVLDTVEVPNNSYVWHRVQLPSSSSSFTLKLYPLEWGFVSVSRLAVGQVDASLLQSAGGTAFEENQPLSFCLYQPFPNPLSDAATIRFSVPYATHVSLKVYDVVGRLVSRLVDEEVPPGVHTLRWTGKDDINRRCASGVYFVRFEATDYQASKKMVLLK